MVKSVSNNPNVQQAQPNIPGGSRLGNHTISITGNPPLALDKLGTEKIPFQGFTKATKKSRAEIGLTQNVFNAMAALSWKDGKINPANIARSLNTVQNYLQREVNLETIKADQVEDEFLARFAEVISDMTNQELNKSYQGLVSRPMQDLLKGIKNELFAGVEDEALRNNLSELYDNISRIEMLLLQEINNRMLISEDPNAAASIPHLTTRFPLPSLQDSQVPFTTQHYVERATDMSAKSLVDMATRSANQSSQISNDMVATDTRMRTHGFDKVSSRELGDIVRSSELTIDVNLDLLLGDLPGMDPGNPPVTQDDTLTMNILELGAGDANVVTDKHQQVRSQVETVLFPNISQDQAAPKEHPAYGALNPQGQKGGLTDGCTLVLKNSVKQQCTYTLKESFLAIPVKVDNDAKERLIANLIAHQEDFSDKTQRLLVTPESDLRQMLDSAFQVLQEAPRATLDNVLKLIEPQLKDYLCPPGGSPDDMDRATILNYLTEPLVDREAAANLGATFDNIESLFTQMKDFDLFYTEQMAEQLRGGQTDGLRLGGSGCIEAQIHTPLTILRDVEAIRANRSAIEAGLRQQFAALGDAERAGSLSTFRGTHDLDISIEDSEVLDMMIQEQADDKINRLRAFAEHAIVKFEVIDSSSDVADVMDEAVAAADDAATAAASRALARELKNAAVAYITSNSLEKLQGRFDMAISTELRVFLQMKFGHQNLAALPKEIQDLFNKSLSTSLSNATKNSPTSLDQVLERVFEGTVQTFYLKLVILDTLQDFEFETPELAKEFKDSLYLINLNKLSADQIPTQLKNHYKLFTFTKRCSAIREDLARQALDSLPEAEAQRMRELVKDGDILVGAAATFANGDISNALNSMRISVNSTYADRLITDKEIMDHLTNTIIRKAVYNKVRLLNAAQTFEFTSPKEKETFEAWILNAGKLKYNEEIIGAYQVSNRILEMLENNPRLTFSIHGLHQIAESYSDIMSPIFVTLGEKGEEMGTDDKLAGLRRAAAAAVSRFIARHGDEGKAALEAALRDEDVQRNMSLFGGLLELATRPSLNLGEDNSRISVAFYMFQEFKATLNNLHNVPPFPRVVFTPIEQITPEELHAIWDRFPVASREVEKIQVQAQARAAARAQAQQQ